jgi:hypothetical protein
MGFIDHLHTPLGITALQLIFTVHKSPQRPVRLVLPSLSLTTASNSGDSSASRAQDPSSHPPVQNSFSTINSTVVLSHLSLPCRAQLDSLLQTVLLITSRHGPHREHSVSNCKSIVTCVFFSAGTCSQSRCSETVVIYSSI